jgi:hypothetical protein
MKMLYTVGLVALGLLVTAAFAMTDGNDSVLADDHATQIEEAIPPGKVHVCHRTGQISDGTVENPSGNKIPDGEAVGRIVVVSENAVAAHCAHGDKLITGSSPHDHGNCRVDKNPGDGCQVR